MLRAPLHLSIMRRVFSYSPSLLRRLQQLSSVKFTTGNGACNGSERRGVENKSRKRVFPFRQECRSTTEEVEERERKQTNQIVKWRMLLFFSVHNPSYRSERRTVISKYKQNYLPVGPFCENGTMFIVPFPHKANWCNNQSVAWKIPPKKSPCIRNRKTDASRAIHQATNPASLSNVCLCVCRVYGRVCFGCDLRKIKFDFLRHPNWSVSVDQFQTVACPSGLWLNIDSS